jgi:hypothetical protein
VALLKKKSCRVPGDLRGVLPRGFGVETNGIAGALERDALPASSNDLEASRSRDAGGVVRFDRCVSRQNAQEIAGAFGTIH